MFKTRTLATAGFKEGDNVVLAEGPHQGTPGIFSRLAHDVNWAEIVEEGGKRRSHPVVWLQHANPQGNALS